MSTTTSCRFGTARDDKSIYALSIDMKRIILEKTKTKMENYQLSLRVLAVAIV